ncbi:MAG: restriction endonuclease [Candidatus Gracilibacteria bacterium]|nr:restriction endonuclease [Candidatus Gracilibacteria bacterium]
MAIPKFNETMLPILKLIGDEKEYTLNNVVDILGKEFNLNEEELSLMSSNGGGQFYNKVGWGKSYLKQAGLVEYPRRGFFKITKEGKKVLKENLDEISVSYLKKYPSFIKFVSGNKSDKQYDEISNDFTPSELLDKGYKNIQLTLKNNLLDQLKEINPYYFERVILELFKKMGYGDFEETPKSRDGGIDGIIFQDQLGIDRIYTQAKRYTVNNITEKEIRNFIGAMSGDVSKGIFVTLSDFDKGAVEKANSAKLHKIILINGSKLADLMIKYNVGVQVKNIYEIKEIDLDFFSGDEF